MSMPRALVRVLHFTLTGALSISAASFAGGDFIDGAGGELLAGANDQVREAGLPAGEKGSPRPAVMARKQRPHNPGTGGVIDDPIFDPGLAPLWSAPGHWRVAGRTHDSVSLAWYEVGNPLNPETLVYRQKYDATGNPLGALTLIKTFTGLPQGPAGFVDSVATTDDQSGPDPDSRVCYWLVEKNGDCGHTPSGYSCYRTEQACAYTRAATGHGIGRLQLGLKVSSAPSAAAPGAHVQVRLQAPYYAYAPTPVPRGNSTWLDSTQVDFTAGSEITYDLKMTGISDLSDITQITIASPGDDSLCINGLKLFADNTLVFEKSWGADGVGCEWAWNTSPTGGSVVSVPFAELRASPNWIGFNPPNLVPPELSNNGEKYASFAGYRKEELIRYLDMIWGDELRNPANGHGDGAGLINTHWTTTERRGPAVLHVTHHVIAQDEGWSGSVAADPSYDLVLHSGASCAPENWCISVENIVANSSYSGWPALIPLIGAGIQIAVNNEADDRLESTLATLGGSSLPDPQGNYIFCFPGDFPADPNNNVFGSRGFGSGSLTLCRGVAPE